MSIPQPADYIISQSVVAEVNNELLREGPHMVRNYSYVVGSIFEAYVAQAINGDYRANLIGRNKGDADLPLIDCKVSLRPGLRAEYLMATCESVEKTSAPPIFVGGLIDARRGEQVDALIGRRLRITGFALRDDMLGCDVVPQYGVPTYCMPIESLHAIADLPQVIAMLRRMQLPRPDQRNVLPMSLSRVIRREFGWELPMQPDLPF